MFFINEAYAGHLPLQGTDVAASWDSLYMFLIWLSVFFFILVVGGMIYFAVKYHHRSGLKPRYITGNHALEAVWVVIPTILLMVIFVWGYNVYHTMTQAPHDAYEIRVIGKQWLWNFQYDNGKTTTNELFVPMNRPVKLVMTSEDVLHSFFIPNFRVKQDVVPGMYTSVWFEARISGKHQVFCAEYCGTSHSGMLAQAIVLTDEEWDAWYKGKTLASATKEGQSSDQVASSQAQSDAAAASAKSGAGAQRSLSGLALQGQKISETKGCVACHTSDGTAKIGPTFKGVFGTKVEFVDGTKAMIDENYIRESIENPQAKLVKGFQPMMPTFKGMLSETEMNAVIAYIKSLR